MTLNDKFTNIQVKIAEEPDLYQPSGCLSQNGCFQPLLKIRNFQIRESSSFKFLESLEDTFV